MDGLRVEPLVGKCAESPAEFISPYSKRLRLSGVPRVRQRHPAVLISPICVSPVFVVPTHEHHHEISTMRLTGESSVKACQRCRKQKLKVCSKFPFPGCSYLDLAVRCAEALCSVLSSQCRVCKCRGRHLESRTGRTKTR